MTISIEELYDRALALSSDVEDKFLELGRSSLSGLKLPEPGTGLQLTALQATLILYPTRGNANHGRSFLLPWRNEDQGHAGLTPVAR